MIIPQFCTGSNLQVPWFKNPMQWQHWAFTLNAPNGNQDYAWVGYSINTLLRPNLILGFHYRTLLR